MSDHEHTHSRPLVLRVEISAEQASSLAPLFEGSLDTATELEPTAAGGFEVSEREQELLKREAEFEADVQIREDRIERWRTELEELEQTLERRERDLVSYVDQLQGAMASSSDAWWTRPAGGDGGVR
jgi:hypothetical protein